MDVEKRDHLSTGGGIVNWCSHLWKTAWRVLKKLKTELPYDPTIRLLGAQEAEDVMRLSSCVGTETL
ncbi:Hypothetical predicted protein [Lynx pardinus]|uniref:Uncharacterized protein n=1 Tax=Lynx pardinus TaxID=191816 RepID=A0A485P1H7_LYNPA|nr:Hypothetical predicted protein [Lynx pardinus]